MMASDIRFTNLGAPRRVWTISAIHGELGKLYALHDAILERWQAGDRLVYLGNYTGYGTMSRETVEEILAFRRLVLSQPGTIPSDITYLRGKQEDGWNRLFHIQFTQNPATVLGDMLENGLRQTFESYDINADDGMRACREGVLALTRWTAKIRQKIRENPAHEIFLTQFRRAAFTHENDRFPLLFVHTGIDPSLKLEEQGESLWQDGNDFFSLTESYAPFGKVIRGYDPTRRGVRINCVTASLDGGSGFGGALVCAGLDKNGNVLELLQA